MRHVQYFAIFHRHAIILRHGAPWRDFLNPAPDRRVSPKQEGSPVQSPAGRSRYEKYSPTRRASPSRAEVRSGNRRGTKSAERRPVVFLRSPQRDILDQSNLGGKPRNLSPSPEKSPPGSDASRRISYSEERRSTSPRGSPHQRRGRIVPPESPNPSRKAADPKTHRDKGSLDTVDTHGRAGNKKSRDAQLTNSDRLRDTADHKEYRERLVLSTITKTTDVSMKNREYDDASRAKDKKVLRKDDEKFPDTKDLPKLSRKSEQKDQNGSPGSPLKETDDRVAKVKEKRKQRKSDRQDAESGEFSSYDSHEDRKESKKRRKEEKKLKKETRRQRREEKRRRKGEKRSEKQKLKSGDASSSSSDLADDHSEDDNIKRRELRASNLEDTESEQKRLEIELREKALKSLRARKGSGN